VILLSILLASPAKDHPFFTQFETYPLVIAHADDIGLGIAPGDTLPFLEMAAGMGADVLEMNVHLTADGHVVLMHDETVDDTTNGSGKVSDMTLEEIKSLEVGVNWTQDSGASYPYRGSGVRVPTLEEVFTEFPEHPMNIEIKADSEELAIALCELIDRYSMTNRVLVASSRDMAMRKFREVCPLVATSADRAEVTQAVLLGYAFLQNPVQPAYQAFQVPERGSGITIMRPAFVQSARNRNLQVHVWTIDEPGEMQRFIDMGVDGILTNKMELLMEILGR
jgi:glycerophosphoryl diester phosphodiesterase